MSKLNTNGWKVIMKVLIAIATTILGALGVQEAGNDKDNRERILFILRVIALLITIIAAISCSIVLY